MTASVRYIEGIVNLMDRLLVQELGKIREAAKLISRAIAAGRTLHAFGTGHSHILAEELFYRAGGLASVNPILEEGLMLHRSALLSTQLERLEGLAAILLKQQPIQAGDVIIIASNSGRNSVTIEMALEAKALGLSVIAITSMNHTLSSNSRHGSGKKLYEIADITIDNHGCVGDASVDIANLLVKVAPTSTVIGAAIVNAIAAEVAELLIQAGVEPEYISSSNTDLGDIYNRRVIQKYKGVVRSL